MHCEFATNQSDARPVIYFVLCDVDGVDITVLRVRVGTHNEKAAVFRLFTALRIGDAYLCCPEQYVVLTGQW